MCVIRKKGGCYIVDIVFSDKVLADITNKGIVLEKAYKVDNSIRIEKGGSLSLELYKEDLKTASRYMEYSIWYKDGVVKKDNIVSRLRIQYEGSEEVDTLLVLLNRDKDLEDGLVENNSIIELQGRELFKFNLKIENRGSTSIDIRDFKVRSSVDVDRNQITDAVDLDILSADTSMSLSSWIDNLQVNTLESNIVAKSVFEGYLLRRDFIHIEDRTIDFCSEDLSDEEVEHLKIKVGNELRGVYYTAIGDHPKAYQYLTINEPKTYIPSITPSESDKFRYMVRRSIARESNLKIHFVDELVEGRTVSNPVISFGNEGLDGRRVGCGRIERGNRGLKISYINKNNIEFSIALDEELGVVINGGNKLEGIDIANDRFKATYTHYSVEFNIEKDTEGRIIKLTDSRGFDIPINYM